MDTNSIVGKIALGIIRHFISGIFAGWAASGFVTNNQATQATGSAMFLISLGFSVWDKIDAHNKLVAAQLAAKGIK